MEHYFGCPLFCQKRARWVEEKKGKGHWGAPKGQKRKTRRKGKEAYPQV